MIKIYSALIAIFSVSLSLYSQNKITFETTLNPATDYLEERIIKIRETCEWIQKDSNETVVSHNNEQIDGNVAEIAEDEPEIEVGRTERYENSDKVDSSYFLTKYSVGNMVNGNLPLLISYLKFPKAYGLIINNDDIVEGFFNKQSGINITSFPRSYLYSTKTVKLVKQYLGAGISRKIISEGKMMEKDSILLNVPYTVSLKGQQDTTLNINKIYYLTSIEKGIATFKINSDFNFSSVFEEGSYSVQGIILGSCVFDIKNKWIIHSQEKLVQKENFQFVSGKQQKVTLETDIEIKTELNNTNK